MKLPLLFVATCCLALPMRGAEVASTPSTPAPHPIPRATEYRVKNPGDLSYADLFSMIETETTMTPDQLQLVRDQYKATDPEVAAKLRNLEDQANASKPPSPESARELAAYKLQVNMRLISAIPGPHKAEFGAAWLALFVLDRLSAIEDSITPAQRKALRELCAPRGASFAGIVNTPERAALSEEVMRETWDTVLTPEQRKRLQAK